jgi:hypothetical protein
VSEPEGRPGWTPPPGTAARIRSRAIWAVASFAGSVPPALIGMGLAAGGSEQADIAMPLAFVFWTIGLLLALWAAFPTLRHWEGLPSHIRWMGALPLLSVSLLLSAALVAAAVG